MINAVCTIYNFLDEFWPINYLYFNHKAADYASHMPILPLPQIIRPSAVRVTDHGSAAEEGKNQSNSILLVANIPHALPALNIRNTNVKRLKKLVEN